MMLMATGTVSSPSGSPVTRNRELLLEFWRTLNLIHAFAYEHASDYSFMYAKEKKDKKKVMQVQPKGR